MNQTFLATKQVVPLWERFLEKEERSSMFCKKYVHVSRFTDPRQTCFATSDVKSCVWRDSGVILSNQKTVFTQHATTWFDAKRVWTRVVKRGTSLFNSFCSIVTKQVALVCCPFYRSLKTALFAFLTCFLICLSVLVRRCVDFNFL